MGRESLSNNWWFLSFFPSCSSSIHLYSSSSLGGWLPCDSKGSHLEGEVGGGVCWGLQSFHPKSYLPPPYSPCPAFSPFFIPPFVCTVGWILSTLLSTSDLSAPSIFFVSSANRSYIMECNASSSSKLFAEDRRVFVTPGLQHFGW